MKKKKTTEYKPADYKWIIEKETEKNPNTGNYDYVLRVIEFDAEFDFESLEEAEKQADKIIKSLMKARIEVQKEPLPVPLKYSKEFTGRLTLRISSELHRKLYIDAVSLDVSLNSLIEKKLAG